MRVCVATPEHYSPAARAMRMEALGVEEWLCDEPFDYANHFADAWEDGSPFILCEWDVIPWPGAIAALDFCEGPWCIYRYPIGRGTPLQWTPALGLGKYRPQGQLPEEVRETKWQLLDGILVPFFHEQFGEPHIHEPPVAHAREGSR